MCCISAIIPHMKIFVKDFDFFVPALTLFFCLKITKKQSKPPKIDGLLCYILTKLIFHIKKISNPVI